MNRPASPTTGRSSHDRARRFLGLAPEQDQTPPASPAGEGTPPAASGRTPIPPGVRPHQTPNEEGRSRLGVRTPAAAAWFGGRQQPEELGLVPPPRRRVPAAEPQWPAGTRPVQPAARSLTTATRGAAGAPRRDPVRGRRGTVDAAGAGWEARVRSPAHRRNTAPAARTTAYRALRGIEAGR